MTSDVGRGGVNQIWLSTYLGETNKMSDEGEGREEGPKSSKIISTWMAP